ncbi:MAG: hypothetical protein OQK75_06495 [Gammaproteobacteria bacterium]|nr:hypothetical protein [Gammaproteobacteria bacterium]MCW8987306.1 hypothetical protein [Gammaproteobacteria bacterium]
MQKLNSLFVALFLMLGITTTAMAEEEANSEQMSDITAYCKAETEGAENAEASFNECITEQLQALKDTNVEVEKEKS